MLDLSTGASRSILKAVPRNLGRRPFDAAAQEHALSSCQVLAISDPNDILSWEVTLNEFEVPRITVANIYLGTTGEVFGLSSLPIWGLAASPVAAHTNYVQDDDVRDIIACGMTGPTITAAHSSRINERVTPEDIDPGPST